MLPSLHVPPEGPAIPRKKHDTGPVGKMDKGAECHHPGLPFTGVGPRLLM